MSPDNESGAMKGPRPPPPVPPRPSRSVVKEALAKTRQAHGMVHGSRVSLSEKNPDEFLNRQTIPLTTHQLQQYNLGQPRFSLGSQNNPKINQLQKSVPCFPSEKLSNNYGMRPVVYQSQNCRNRQAEDNNNTTSIKNVYISHIDKRPVSRSVGKSSFKEDLLKKEPNSEMAHGDTSCDNPLNRRSPKLVDVKAKYANILEQKNVVKAHDGDASRKPSSENDATSNSTSFRSTNSNIHENLSGKHWDDILNDRNHVNTLIDEMFASVLEVNLGSSISPSSSNESIANEAPNKITISHNTPTPTNTNSDDENLTVIVINEDRAVSESVKSSTSSSERKVTFNDRENHEFLIEELQSMQHHQGKVSKRQHLGSLDSVNGVDKIHMNDWYGVNDGKKVRLSSCHITIEDPCEDGDQISKRNQKINNISRAYRLPPLPKSLSGFKFLDNSEGLEINESMQSDEKVQFNYSELKVDVSGREQTNLDRQLALLRREMVSLREQDLSLLSKLWFLSESIHDFRQMMQEQDDDKINARLSPSPTPSSIDDEDYYVISASTC